MKRIYLFSIVIIFILTAMPATAQHYFGLYLNGSTPLNELKDSAYRNGIGFSMEYLSPTLIKAGNFEARVGAGIDFLHFGRSKKVEDLVFNTPNNDKGYSRLENYSFDIQIAPKFIYNAGKISPYIDLFTGIRGFYSTQTNTFNKQVQGYEKSSSNTLLQNAVVHSGGSVGLIYNLTSSVAFDLRFSYSTGAGIKFTDLGSARKDPAYESNILYRNTNTVKNSDLFIFRIGVLFKLERNENQITNSYENNYRYNYNVPQQPKKPAEVKPVPKPAPPVNY